MRRGVLSLVAIALSIPVLFGAATGSFPLEVAAVRLVVLAIGVSILDAVLGALMSELGALFGNGSERLATPSVNDG